MHLIGAGHKINVTHARHGMALFLVGAFDWWRTKKCSSNGLNTVLICIGAFDQVMRAQHQCHQWHADGAFSCWCIWLAENKKDMPAMAENSTSGLRAQKQCHWWHADSTVSHWYIWLVESTTAMSLKACGWHWPCPVSQDPRPHGLLQCTTLQIKPAPLSQLKEAQMFPLLVLISSS